MPALVVALDQNVNSIQHVTSVMQELVSTVNELKEEIAQLRSRGAPNNSNAHIAVPDLHSTSQHKQPSINSKPIISKPITNKTLKRWKEFGVYILWAHAICPPHSMELNHTVNVLKDTSAKAKSYSRFKALISVIKDYACAHCLAPGDAAEQLDLKSMQLKNKSLNHFLDSYRAGKIK
ncbi:hypothetical protein ROZALSC1DRAFT_31547 [Rozella allomycis CSF55]|uniref:Uncharacterized protein n=1 Tax=Rozella allomycis (strain CSF55) TaxID=988480 RepID=A0A075B3C8_ROZAC|nr:hypothetical protein O9G_005008 [Rozella allomycis CSF55]RKP16537.1 hypothetical protein ROZALSC1DRAFT_31547 [Rozella allomycis CSF55]|eukprot:EPZ35471.1 hypothetical protein O9G_005008 [Rozella allomycis CSF55]